MPIIKELKVSSRMHLRSEYREVGSTDTKKKIVAELDDSHTQTGGMMVLIGIASIRDAPRPRAWR